MLVTILILCLFLIHITLAHDKCVLRLEDVDMPTFVIDLDRDIATNISVVSQDEISVNETACDLTDPAFFESLTFAYNISNLESVLAYARFAGAFIKIIHYSLMAFGTSLLLTAMFVDVLVLIFVILIPSLLFSFLLFCPRVL